jgi:hypothetical protein
MSELNYITGFVMQDYYFSGWLRCVLSVEENPHEVKITVFHPRVHSNHSEYKTDQNIYLYDT